MNGYLLDTSFVGHYLHTKRCPDHLAERMESILAHSKPVMAFVSLYEIRRGLHGLQLGLEGRKKRARIDFFLKNVTWLGLDERGGLGWEFAARLHTEGRAGGLVAGEGDLLIGATALFHAHKLVTCDRGQAEFFRAIGYDESVEHVPIDPLT